MSSLCIAAVSVLLFAASGWAQQEQAPYIITKTGTTFRATMNNNLVATNERMILLLDTIRARSYGNPVAIQFGAGGARDTLDVGTLPTYIRNVANVTPAWGEVTLTGNVKHSGGGNALYFMTPAAETTPDLVVNSSLSITTDGTAIYAYERVSLTITGGVISSSMAGGYAVYVSSVASIKMTGGEINAPLADYGIYIGNANSTADITGGKITGAEGRNAIYSYGKVSISGDAEVIGNTGNASSGVVCAFSAGGIEIGGGTVTNLADSGNAVYLGSAAATLTLVGNNSPKITGGISSMAPGSIIASSFTPGTNEYTLAPRSNARVDSAVVVVGAGAHLSKFKYVNQYYELFKKGNDIGVKLKSTVTVQSYVVTDVTVAGSFSGYKITRNGSAWKNDSKDFVGDIREDAKGRPCNIQLGDGTTALKGNGNGVTLSISQSTGSGWGRVTLSGKLISTRPIPGPPAATYAVYIYGASVSSSLEITSTDHGEDVYVSGFSDYTHTGGTLHNCGIGVYGGGSAAITGGIVHSMRVSGTESSADITGGTVGSTSLNKRALYVYPGGYAAISGTAAIVSADTNANGGTIVNTGGTVVNIGGVYDTIGGTLTISGGTVSNLAAAGGCAVRNNGKGAVTTISGGDITARNASTYANKGGVVVNGGDGVMEISGGKITLDQPTGWAVMSGTGTLTISGTADIYKSGVNGYAVYSNGSGDSTIVTSTNIIGGTIRCDSCAAVSGGGAGSMTTISGTADITSANRIYTVTFGSNSKVSLLGGTITNTADTGAAIFCGMKASAGWLTLGGSPTLNGYFEIRMGYTYMYGSKVEPTEITILTSGEHAFAPGDKVYGLEMWVCGGEEGRVMLINGAAFAQNFALDTSQSNSGTRFKLAANGNDAVATQNNTYEVSFALNGATGKVPTSFRVMEGGTIGVESKPSTKPYLSPSVAGLCPQGKCANDGDWHIDQGGDPGEAFVFSGAGVTGRPVLGNTKLTLKWTDKVSVLEVSREVPGAPKQGTAVIAPVVIPAGEFTVGPNPVAKHAGAVSFFWSGAAVKGGKLFVYDASGNLVKKISVSGAGTGAAASWDLTDAKGRPAASGTYAAKGVIKTNSGKSEKVSVLRGAR
jgi:hypothetical protein